MLKNKELTCCFTGHRPKSLLCKEDENHPTCVKIKAQLKKMIIGLIEKKNVFYYISGAALGVDMWAMEIVIELKKRYPSIKLEVAVPCEVQCARWSQQSKERYNNLLGCSDKVTIVQKEYTHDCMMNRNKYMVDKSDFVLAVWNRKPSGTSNTIKYAKQRGKTVYCIDAVDFTLSEL